MEAARRLTTADGTRLAYWLWQAGPERRRLLVLIHGAASNHTRWSEFLEQTELKESWDVLRPDMRGNGESLVRGRLDTEIWSRDLAEILAVEGYPSGLVIGHSLGAQIAIHFAARYPRRTDGLVLIDPVFRRALIGRKRRISRTRPLFLLAIWMAHALNSLGIYRRHIPNRDLKDLDRETRKELESARSKEEIAKKYSALGPILRYMPTANYLQQLVETVGPLPDLAAIRCPVLVLLSAGITFADAEINKQEIERFPRVEVAPIEANHWPLTEQPAQVRRAIEEWVEANYPTGRL
ncbi:MAG: alpha/beta hydrolase [Acidobacteria bacterium]|nr:MAG: alpha/beta hydrolase [Acidobacteriota bacterium]